MAGTMKRVHALLLRDLLGLGLGLLIVFCGVSLALEGVELLNTTTDSTWGGEDLSAWFLTTLPIALYGVLPVVMAVCSVVVLRRWRENGRVVSLLSVGVSPTRVLSVVGVAGLLLSALVVLTHEVVLPISTTPSVRVAEWVEVAEEEHTTYVMVGASVGTQLLDVRVARIMNGQIVGHSVTSTMRIEGSHWSGADDKMLALMPSIERWRAAAVSLGPSIPIRVLATAAPSLRRDTALMERALTPLFVSLVALIAGAFAMLVPRQALVLAIVVSGFGQLVFRSVLTMAGRGAWPISAALVVALAPAVVAAVWMLLRLERGR
jgi:lipopolysaccharide export LptBFGC system permease protein LptF